MPADVKGVSAALCKFCERPYDPERDGLLVYHQNADFVCADCTREGLGSMEFQPLGQAALEAVLRRTENVPKPS